MCLNKVGFWKQPTSGSKQNGITGAQEIRHIIEGDFENPSKRVTL